MFSTVRVWALCGRVTWQVVMVLFPSMFVPAVNIVRVSSSALIQPHVLNVVQYNYSRPQIIDIVDGACASTPLAFAPAQ